LDEVKDTSLLFRFALAKEETAPVRALLSNLGRSLDQYQVGDVLEVAPDAALLVKQFADRMVKARSGMALIMDYGSWQPSQNTVRVRCNVYYGINYIMHHIFDVNML
jgi:SAM-dependent MidA family methyltransferase